MAELGATVIAFVSLAKLVQPLYNACSTIHGAPRDFQFFHNQLGSLRFVVAELGRLQDNFPADLISDKIADALSGSEEPFLDDIALLKTLLEKLGTGTRTSNTGTGISGWGRIKFLFKSGDFKQLAQRIGTYRDSLNTILLLINSQYLPRHHDLLIKTYSATTRVESLMATHYGTMEPNRQNPTLVKTWKSATHADSIVNKLQTTIQNLHIQQQANFDAFTSQIAAMDSMVAEISRTTTQGMAYSSSGPRIDFQSFKRLEFNFFFGSVVVSWGPLRRHAKKIAIDDFHEEFGYDSQSAAQSLGSAVAVEIVPATWISRRAIIGSLNMTRDQRCSPTISPGLSFPLTVQATAEVMSCATLGDIAGLRLLFNDRKASVTDRLDGGWTPLHVAVAAGQTLTCKFLLGNSADVTVTGRVGLTPLHLAAAYGHLDIIKLLVNHDSDPEAYNQHGFNAMFETLHSPFIADRNDKADIIKYMLQQEHFVVNVNSQDYQGNSMLGWFAQHHPAGVKLLLDHDAEVNSRAYDGATPLHRAAARGSLAGVKLLMQAGAESTVIENDGSTALVQAASGGYLDIVRQLTYRSSQDDLIVENYKPVQLHCEPGMPGPSDVVNQIIRTCSHLKHDDPQRNFEICQAAQQGYWAVVSALQEAGVDPYKKDEYGYRALVRLVYKQDLQRVNELIKSERTSMVPDDDLALALVRAAAAGHGEVLTHLLSITEPGFFENAVGSKALVAAAKFGRVEFVQLLLPYVPQHCWYRALVRGAENGHIDVVNLFLSKGIHPTREGAGGDTAIVRAARYGHLAVVQKLLEAGADPDQHGWFGYSALVRASYNGFLEVVDCLLSAGASPDLAEIGGDTAMVRSMRQGHTSVMERLLKSGACRVDDTREVDGPSKALMKAAIYNHQDILLRFLKDGADPNIVEPDGNTPLSRACENGHMNIVSTLLEWNARVSNPSKASVSPLERAAEQGHSDIVNMLLVSNSPKIPVSEKCKAMLKASENGHADIAASILDDGMDLQKQSMETNSIGLVHFSILNHWMGSVVPDKQALTALSPPLDVDNKTNLPCARGPPTWGFDGFLVARFRAPFRITFTSDLTSSRVRYMWSLVLLKTRYALELIRRFSFSLVAAIVLLLGLGLLGVEYAFRAILSL